MHIRDLKTGPPGGWQFRQKESNFSMSGITFGSLLGKVAQHRTNLNYPPVSEGFLTLADEVEAHICQSLSPEDQYNNCDTGVTAARSVHWKLVAQFLKTLASWFLIHGLKRVEQDEAERRAAICAKCPLNVGMNGCGTCRAALQGVREALMNAHTSQDAELRACGVCGCDNKMQVHVPIDSLNAATNSKTAYPDWCWKHSSP